MPGMIYDADLRHVGIDMLRGLGVVFTKLFYHASEHLLHPAAKMCWRTRMVDVDTNWCLHELLARLRAMALACEKELTRRKLVYQYPESQFSLLTRSPDTPNLRYPRLSYWRSTIESPYEPHANEQEGLSDGYNFNDRMFGWAPNLQGSGRDYIRKRMTNPPDLPSTEEDPTITSSFGVKLMFEDRDAGPINPRVSFTGPTEAEQHRSNAEIRHANPSTSTSSRKGGGRRALTPQSDKGSGKRQRSGGWQWHG